MTRRELKKILKAEGFDLSFIRFRGGKSDYKYYIQKIGDKWCYYYLERGIKCVEQCFDTESEACEALLEALRRLPESQTRIVGR